MGVALLDENTEQKPYRTRAENRGAAISLKLLFADGNAVALPYPYLAKSSLDRAGTISLEFGGTVVELTGRNLADLFDYIIQHKASEIEEVPERLDSYPGRNISSKPNQNQRAELGLTISFLKQVSAISMLLSLMHKSNHYEHL